MGVKDTSYVSAYSDQQRDREKAHTQHMPNKSSPYWLGRRGKWRVKPQLNQPQGARLWSE